MRINSPHRRIHCHEVRRTKKSKKPPRSYSFSWKRKRINRSIKIAPFVKRSGPADTVINANRTSQSQSGSEFHFQPSPAVGELLFHFFWQHLTENGWWWKMTTLASQPRHTGDGTGTFRTAFFAPAGSDRCRFQAQNDHRLNHFQRIPTLATK